MRPFKASQTGHHRPANHPVFLSPEQRPQADGSLEEEGRRAQAGLRLQEEARHAGHGYGGVGEKVCRLLQSISICPRRPGSNIMFEAAQLSMNNVMQNEGEYVMQISALTSSLNVRTEFYF